MSVCRLYRGRGIGYVGRKIVMVKGKGLRTERKRHRAQGIGHMENAKGAFLSFLLLFFILYADL